MTTKLSRLNKPLIYKKEVYEIVGAAMEVHSTLGSGFLERVYHEALKAEFNERNIPFKAEQGLEIHYKGKPLKAIYRADFVCYDKIILEIKAVKETAPEHVAQTINYLKITNFKVGVLINFGKHDKLEWERFINTPKKRS